MKKIVFLALVATGVTSWGSVPWCDELWLGRGMFWTSRVALEIDNPSAAAWKGRTVSVPVDRLPLKGVRVEELRLVDAKGVQLEYGVWAKGGWKQVREGLVPPDGVLTIPAVCGAGEKTTYQLYFGNPKAWGLSDFWEERSGDFVNGGFEQIEEACPAGWQFLNTNATHRLEIADTGANEGGKCICAEARQGSEKSWFSCSQSGIRVYPGERVRFRVKIHGENVEGNAGWYVHVVDGEGSLILNKVFHGGTGTFDWKTLEQEVVVPENCTRMTMGSVLWGTGRAWYDDVQVEFANRTEVEPVVKVGPVERLSVRMIGGDAEKFDAKWSFRVPIRVANFLAEDIPHTLMEFSLREATRAIRNPEYRLTLDGQEVKTCELGGRVLFVGVLPAKSVTTYSLWVRPGRRTGVPQTTETAQSVQASDIPSDQVLVQSRTLSNLDIFTDVLSGPANLVVNGDFEDGLKGWSTNPLKGVAFEQVGDGFLGKSCAKMTIPESVTPNWNGWRQVIPVKPGHAYFYGAFLRGENLRSPVTVHVHLLTEEKSLSSGGMQSAGDSVTGTMPWTPVFATFRATEDTKHVNLQLTMNGTGTIAHDGVLLAEFREAKIGDLEFAPSQKTDQLLQVAQVDPVVKVFRETPVEETAGRPISIALARNEAEALQIAVRSSRSGRLELTVESPLPVEIGRVDYVPVDWPTAYYSCTTPRWELRYPQSAGASDGWSGWWPDPISPARTADLTAQVTQPFWLTFKTDARTKPGDYSVRLVWRLDGTVVRTDAASVHVWDFEIPARPRFPAVYDIRMGPLWNGLGTTDEERRERMWSFMAEKKICPDTIGADVKFTRRADGSLTADFTNYDRLATRYFDHYQFPASYTPGCFYCFGWALLPHAFLGENPYPGEWPYAGADRTKLRPEYRRIYQQALRLYWDHVKAKGWADRITLYISDEPHYWHANVVQQMKALCAMIHEVDPSIRIYSSTWRHCPEWNDALDVWGVGHYGCFPVSEMAARKAAGKRIWWTTDGQMCLDTPYCAVERLLPHYAHKFGADLYEFWGCSWLTYDPWKFGWHAYIRQSDTPGETYWVRYPAGDGYLFYPPRDGDGPNPVTSVRLEAARDGVEDYSYLELLAARAKRDPAAADLLKQFHSELLIPNAGGRYSMRILPDPERIGRLRQKAGDLLSRP